MKAKVITVTAATGNIGKKLVRNLLKSGAEVRAISRDAAGLKELAELGAKAAVGSLDDLEFVTSVFKGSDGVFLLIPPDYVAKDFRGVQNLFGDVMARAVKQAGVKHVVNLSSLGAEHSSGTGPIKGLHDQEQRLNQLAGISLTHLRAAYFFENMMFGLPLIKGQNIYGTAIKGDVKFAQTATQDIADAAARELLATPVVGARIVEVIGERDVSMNEVTAAISKIANKAGLSYIAFPYEDTRNAIIASGLSPDVADQFVEMYDAINSGRIKSTVGRSAANTTKTSVESFVKANVQVF